MAKYADKHHYDIFLNVGDLVYVSTEHFLLGHASCLISSLHVGVDLFPSVALFRGLYIILTCQKKKGRIHLVFYFSYLCPHVGPVPARPPSPLPLDDNAAGEFEVEEILDSCLDHYGTEYLVKWLGYPTFKATWESAEHLANAPDILQ